MNDLNRILTTVAPDRREFLKRILAAAGFVAPAICSFSLATTASAAPVTGTSVPTTQSTTTTTTTAAPTTTPAPTTTSCLGGIGPNGCWPDAE